MWLHAQFTPRLKVAWSFCWQVSFLENIVWMQWDTDQYQMAHCKSNQKSVHYGVLHPLTQRKIKSMATGVFLKSFWWPLDLTKGRCSYPERTLGYQFEMWILFCILMSLFRLVDCLLGHFLLRHWICGYRGNFKRGGNMSLHWIGQVGRGWSLEAKSEFMPSFPANLNFHNEGRRLFKTSKWSSWICHVIWLCKVRFTSKISYLRVINPKSYCITRAFSLWSLTQE